ncbi:Sec-independent protein translocase subunit TatA [Kitasatospora sp. NPDC057015]|uniref:Sec-independent protein translocase subunit TatA n=1 Tax=Kitasatospora sp. NPDC057015 TaxID=3346001 RepID=UPI00363DDA21
MLRNGLEPWHLLVMLAIVLLLFGSKKLPEMARGLGKSMRILKAETRAMREDDASADESGQNITASSRAVEAPHDAVTPASTVTAAEIPQPRNGA